MNLFYKKISGFTLRHAWLIVAATVLLTGLSLYTTSSLKFKGDFIDLLPSDFTSVQGLNEIKKRSGGEGYLVVVLETDELEKAKIFAEQLVLKLKALPDVNYVDYKFNKQFFEDRNLLYVSQEDLNMLEERLRKKIDYEKNRLNPFYVDLLDEKYEFNIDDIKDKYSTAEIKDYYITENPKRLVILIKPSGFANNLEFCKRLLANTRAAVASLHPTALIPSMKVLYTGRYVTRIEETEFMFEDLKRTSIFAIIGVLLLITIYARSGLAIFFVGTPLIISIIYALAFTTLTVGHLNIVTSILVGLLTGMGIDFGVHLYWRYLEERRRKKTLEEAIHTIHRRTGKSLFLAGFTTAAAFFVLYPTEFIGFSEFGWIASAGVMSCLLTTYLLLPALIVLREKIPFIKQNFTKFQTPPDFMNTPQKYPKPWLTIGFFILFSLFSIWGLTQLEFDYDFRKFSADKHGTLALQEEISDAFGVALTPSIVYASRLEDIPQLTKDLHRIRDSKPNSTIQKGLSLYSYTPENQEAKILQIRKLGKIANEKILRLLEGEEAQRVEDLKRWAQAQPFGVSDLPEHLQQQYKAVNGYPGSFLFIFPEIDLWHGKDLIRFADEIKTFQQAHQQSDIYMASEALIFSDILTLIKNEGPLAFLASFLMIFLILLIDFRKFSDVLLVLSPLCVSILCLAGAMVLLGIKLNFMNAIIFPILLGLGIDYGVYIIHRYQETGKGSLVFVLRQTGAAIFLSSATTIIGFGSLLTAVHRGLNSIGLLAVLGLFLIAVTSVTLLPAILQIIENRSNYSAKGKS